MNKLLRRGSVGTFILKVSNIFIVFVTNFILAKFIKAKEYGIYVYVISWSSVLSTLSLIGLHLLVVREVAIYKTKKDWEGIHELYSWTKKIVFIFSSILAIIGGTLLPLISQKASVYEFRLTIWFGMILVPLLSLIYLYQGILRGLGCVIKAQIPFLFIFPCSFLFLILVFHFITKLNSFLVINLRILAMGLAVLTSFLFLKMCLLIKNNNLNIHKKYFSKNWLKSALPLFLFSIGQIINQRISIILLGNLIGPIEAGIFDITFKVSTFVDFTLMIINMPLAPIIAEFYTQNKKEELQNLITKSTRIAFIGSLLVAMCLIFFGNLIFLLIGKEFCAGYPALIILGLGRLINVGMGPVALLLNMTKYESLTAKGIGFSAIINTLLNIILIPKYQLIGAAIANSISIILWNILLSIWVYKKLSIYSTVIGKFKI